MSITEPPRPALPPLLMGLPNMLYGAYGALCLLTVPQLLAAEHVPEPVIAAITAAAMIPTFLGFLVAPIIDVRFSRRSYALAFGLATALITVAAVLSIHAPARLAPLLILGFLAANLYYNALGGWLADVVPESKASQLAAGFTIGNVGGFGISAVVFIVLIRLLPGLPGAVAAGVVVALPMLILRWIPPSPDADRRAARESFAILWRDLRALVRKPAVLRTLLIFALPAASFALTNTLGGLGAQYGASEQLVGLVAGIGSTLAGIVGSLLMPPIARRMPPLVLYLLIGSVGAAFTLSLIVLPHTPAMFAVALIGQNAFQAAAFTVESTIIFGSIGVGNPLAATQFAFLQAATALPITYMQAIDGQAYGRGALASMYAVDAGAALVAALVLLALSVRWRLPVATPATA